jgi:hypothetical protein
VYVCAVCVFCMLFSTDPLIDMRSVGKLHFHTLKNKVPVETRMPAEAQKFSTECLPH